MKLTLPISFVLYSLFWSVLPATVLAQNIVGLRVIIGEDAPAFIAFPSEVENVRWDNTEMNDFYKISTRNENTIQISYNGKNNPPSTGTGFSVIQGKNTHLFTLVFKKDYDINKDPVLYYDFSDKGKLKAAAANAKATGNSDEAILASSGSRANGAERHHGGAEQKKVDPSLAQQQKQQEAERQQKEATTKALEADKKRDEAIATAKAEAKQKEQEQLKAREREAAIAKADAEAESKKKQEIARLKKKKADEDRKAAIVTAQQEKEEKQQKDSESRARLAAERKAAEDRRIEQQQERERLQAERLATAEAERSRKLEQAKQEAQAKRLAKEEAEMRLLALQKEKAEAKEKDQYSMSGLYNRYGKGPNGINFYDIPPEQYNFNNADFYVVADTIENFQNSQQLLTEPPRLKIESATRKNVSLVLQGISFKGAFAYYHLKLVNNSKEDYLMGANNLAWYHEDGSAKFLKCSYLTYIGFFPVVKPGEAFDYMYVTRAANINEPDKLVFTVMERRADKPQFELYFDGAVYRKEQSRVQKELKHEDSDTKPDTAPKEKKSKKGR